eukprot:scaffold44437_cov26-Prasinocladus_malaysianus.AAC.1
MDATGLTISDGVMGLSSATFGLPPEEARLVLMAAAEARRRELQVLDDDNDDDDNAQIRTSTSTAVDGRTNGARPQAAMIGHQAVDPDNEFTSNDSSSQSSSSMTSDDQAAPSSAWRFQPFGSSPRRNEPENSPAKPGDNRRTNEGSTMTPSADSLGDGEDGKDNKDSATWQRTDGWRFRPFKSSTWTEPGRKKVGLDEDDSAEEADTEEAEEANDYEYEYEDEDVAEKAELVTAVGENEELSSSKWRFTPFGSRRGRDSRSEIDDW